jgi:hypothetical protein
MEVAFQRFFYFANSRFFKSIQPKRTGRTSMTEHCDKCKGDDSTTPKTPLYQGSFTATYAAGPFDVSIDWKWYPGNLSVYATIIVAPTGTSEAKQANDSETDNVESSRNMNFAVYQELPDTAERCNVCAVQVRCLEEVVNPAISQFLTDLHNAYPDGDEETPNE